MFRKPAEVRLGRDGSLSRRRRGTGCAGERSWVDGDPEGTSIVDNGSSNIPSARDVRTAIINSIARPKTNVLTAMAQLTPTATQGNNKSKTVSINGAVLDGRASPEP